MYEPSLLYLGFLTLPFSSLFFPPSHPTSPMPIQLHKIQLYRLWYLWQRLRRNVRPTSQCWAVSPAALFFAAPDDNDYLNFSHDDLFFHQHFCSLIYNNDDRTLHDISVDSTMTSPLLCDKPTYLLAGWSRYTISFSLLSNHRLQSNTTALTACLFRYTLSPCVFYLLGLF